MSLLHTTGGGEQEEKLDSSSVFSTYLYTGNGATQTINNGIDLAGKGGMVWTKWRSGVFVAQDHGLYDTSRGVDTVLSSDLTKAQHTTTNSITAFNSNGYTMGADATYGLVNYNTCNYASWTFRKAPKFFDIVTYTGDGTTNRVLSHSLGQEVGMIQSKSTSTTGNWNTYHRSATGDLALNTTDAQTASKTIIPSATSTTFTVNDVANTNGVTYVAYLYAHDTSADGLIQCGSFTTDGSGNATVTLGWEPQFIIGKRVSSTSDWEMLDCMRGLTATAVGNAILLSNYSHAETPYTFLSAKINSTGFTPTSYTSSAFIYMAIRRPNKVPTSGTEVYNAIARTGTGSATSTSGIGFAPDMYMISRKAVDNKALLIDRLRGNPYNFTNQTSAESVSTPFIPSPAFDSMDGVRVGASDNTNRLNEPYIDWAFKRAKGFFDIVCYTGTGVARTVNHNLGVVPELMIVKCRSNGVTNWLAWSNGLTNAQCLVLNLTVGTQSATTVLNSTSPTASVFTVGTDAGANTNTATYVAYLFATLANVSKCFSYTGNGTSLNVECGFSTGARFVLCKRTDSTGDWFVFDSVRGIVAANDPHLSLNTTAAEVTTDDSIDPYANGFTVNQNATTNLNVNGGTYIGLAIA